MGWLGLVVIEVGSRRLLPSLSSLWSLGVGMVGARTTLR